MTQLMKRPRLRPNRHGSNLVLSTRELTAASPTNALVVIKPVFVDDLALDINDVLALDVHWGHDEAWNRVDFRQRQGEGVCIRDVLGNKRLEEVRL